jgi:DNA-binding MarR family transcriptional regulator
MHEQTSEAVSVEDVAKHLEQLSRFYRRPSRAPRWLAHELTFSQLRLLFLLREEGPVSMSRLAETLGVTVATASGLIDRIEKRGLATRRHRSDDRRVVECALGERGQRLLREMAGARLEAVRQTLDVLTPEELTQFDRLLGLIGERLAARAEARAQTEAVRPV